MRCALALLLRHMPQTARRSYWGPGAAVCSATARRSFLTYGVMCSTHWSGVAASSASCSPSRTARAATRSPPSAARSGRSPPDPVTGFDLGSISRALGLTPALEAGYALWHAICGRTPPRARAARTHMSSGSAHSASRCADLPHPCTHSIWVVPTLHCTYVAMYHRVGP